nr:MAG TPA: zinc-ribbon containing domain protein [Caudoviricetes sp.]
MIGREHPASQDPGASGALQGRGVLLHRYNGAGAPRYPVGGAHPLPGRQRPGGGRRVVAGGRGHPRQVVRCEARGLARPVPRRRHQGAAPSVGVLGPRLLAARQEGGPVRPEDDWCPRCGDLIPRYQRTRVCGWCGWDIDNPPAPPAPARGGAATATSPAPACARTARTKSGPNESTGASTPSKEM